MRLLNGEMYDSSRRLKLLRSEAHCLPSLLCVRLLAAENCLVMDMRRPVVQFCIIYINIDVMILTTEKCVLYYVLL